VLPGGVEIENPRLATAIKPEDPMYVPDRIEFLDDRVILFSSVYTTPCVYRYMLRVITPGEFILPPIEASCMYDAGYASIHGEGRVSVTQ
jgi:uncharacterized protein YfaS (alpha-2-macroglobulin family)